jgi:uncharacterized protein YbjT (DUF2867 family)
MKVLVVGATGFIGARVAQALIDSGHEVHYAGRVPSARLRNGCGFIPLDYSHPLPLHLLSERLSGFEVVINAVGILRERGTQTFSALHDAGPRALFTACSLAGVRRVVQVSALGASAEAMARYHTSKHAADLHLRQLPLDWAIVQPSLVYGGGGSSARLFDLLATLPLTPLPAGGHQRVQPVHVADLVAAVLRLVASPAQLRCTLEVVGPEPLTLRDFLAQLRSSLGLPPTRAVPVPRIVMRAVARAGDHLPSALLDSDTWGMLERGNTGDANALTALLEHPPRSVEQFIPAAEVHIRAQDAQLSWLLPLLRWGVGLMWIIAAVVSAGLYPVSRSLALLADIGVPAPLAHPMLMGAVALDLALGITTLLPRRPRWLWSAQLALVMAYTLIITVTLPHLWLEPFGPVAKNIPILAMLLLLRQLEPRR